MKSAKSENAPITIAYGDGIGPEIMEAVLNILREAEAKVHIDTIEVGEQVYKKGHASGIGKDAWDSIFRNKVLLKAPITTPQGGGYKSLNVTMRKTLGLFANVRPTVTYAPYVPTNFPDMDLVIVRENEEDLYAGIEHRQTDDSCQSLKLITRPGCEKIARYAFDYAVKNGRKKVTCMSKDNIMKMADGLFHKTFDEVAKEYPQIKTEHYIIDIGAARIAAKPGLFDVIVTENLYGDIISDIAAEVSGSVGLAGSSNIGREYAMFEAIHGSAPDIAGKNIANPSGLLNAAIMMLIHVRQPESAEVIHNAWLKTLEDGIHTGDVYSKEHSSKKVGTKEFAEAVVANLGSKPKHFKPVKYEYSPSNSENAIRVTEKPRAKKELVGVDMFVHFADGDANVLGPRMEKLSGDGLKLKLMDCRGLKVWPNPPAGIDYPDHWRARFLSANDGSSVNKEQVIALLQRASKEGIDFIKAENLYTFDGERGYSLAQGE